MDSNSVLTAGTIATIHEFAARLAAIQPALASTDGLAYFNQMYALVTAAVSANLSASAFADPAWMSDVDVVFANLYLDALRNSVQAPDQVPRAWAALLERRSDMHITPLQFALAGMNAHINRDLPAATTATGTELHTTPDSGSHHADFERVNAPLASVERAIGKSVEGQLLLGHARTRSCRGFRMWWPTSTWAKRARPAGRTREPCGSSNSGIQPTPRCFLLDWIT